MEILENNDGHGSSATRFRALLLVIALFAAVNSYGEVCTTQSQMKPADRDVIASAAKILSSKVQTNDIAGLRTQSVPEIAKDYASMTSLVAATSTKIAAAPLAVDQIYLLDATNLKTLADGTNQDSQFFCSLNNSIAEATFFIPALPPGRYAYAQVLAPSATSPWRLAYLLRQDASGNWAMAGFYPRSLTAASHDGLWYWTQARDQIKNKHLWTGYLLYQEAQSLLQPVGFVGSTHLEQLHKEASASAPPALSEGISPEAPLVVKGQTGAEFRFTNLTTDDSIGGDKLYVVVHLAPDPEPEPATTPGTPPAKATPKPAPATAPLSPKDRNASAMVALLAAYPELKSTFGGVWVFADNPGKNPFVTEQPMAEIR
ncbi:hypothetical protein HDF16_004341 [Granulicella aggregans]|uniref:Uncharacterized protein n=1 Tax=Granulicella aggregans TaxID=474949 RepID=A0A7W8E6U3_9BACT|nr:hypothetical protein [Granulicella aggregans]MBB5059615.1 hypothetical protein [Granulicella aggregans]